MKIPEIKLIPTPESIEAKEAIGFKYNDEAGSRHKIGGEPDFVQGENAWPKCCGDKMTFYGQLDSVGDEYSLGDCGMVYVFVCFGCFNSVSFVQSH
ncbi:hypothetical protein [Shewanella zhangzhouensis]|uniref:hypothetical protein n=1 Tax=Shewanella zhangzhouensis TaxID=2864213 RepID=UPI001C65CF89|nr:hypothetical protein [Shewanella zhangzhouensis]QYK04482.1 hypothetical protein K0H63_15655 [Shewanella zhangzhouensis]